MLPDRSVKPLVLELKPSRSLFVIHIVLFALSLTTLILLFEAHLLLKFILVLSLSVYVFYLLRKSDGGYLSGHHPVLTLRQNNVCKLELHGTKHANTRRLKLLEDSWVSNFVIILHFEEGSTRRFYLTLFPDSLKGDDYRKLRVLLNQARFAESEMAEE